MGTGSGIDGMSLQGATAILTGASRGLGSAIAHAMSNAGAELLLVARSEERLRKLQERLPGTAHIFPADLLDASAPAAIVQRARTLWPRLDILVNNAGVTGPVGLLADNDWNEWRDAFQVNFLAPAELCKRAIEWMGPSGGRIVNLSGGGATGPRPRFSAYGSAKCALVRFSETIAAEVTESGIRVNCISPGMLRTDMLQDVLRAGPGRLGEEEYAHVLKAAAGEMADPDVAAALVVYLASEASAGITGKLISAVWDPWRTLSGHASDLRGTDIYTLRRITPEDRGKDWGSK
jgi:NAD(P)-dependent dehydrogenase (short-subunit alcohol dehydrogenase family)